MGTIEELVTAGKFGRYAVLVGKESSNFRPVIVDASGNLVTNFPADYPDSAAAMVLEDLLTELEQKLETADLDIDDCNYLSVNVKDLAGLDHVHDLETGRKALLVSRSHGHPSFVEEYSTNQTNTVLITCTTAQKICVGGVYAACEGNTGLIDLDFACRVQKVFRAYPVKYQHTHENDFHVEGLAGESLILNTTTGTDKVFLIVNYRILDIVAADFPELTVVDWQKNAATGTAANPEGINDDLLGTYAVFNAVGEYCEIEFDTPFYVNKFRYHGYAAHLLDGTYKLQYFDCDTQAWVDWKTGIPTRKNTWSDWDNLDLVLTKKVRIVATAIDSYMEASFAREWELKYQA